MNVGECSFLCNCLAGQLWYFRIGML